MGYSPIRTQLMYDRPYATTLVVSVAIAFLGDCWGQRGYGFFFSGILAMVGYILYLTSTNISVLYGSIFLTNHGSVHARLGRRHMERQPHYKHSTAVEL